MTEEVIEAPAVVESAPEPVIEAPVTETVTAEPVVEETPTSEPSLLTADPVEVPDPIVEEAPVETPPENEGEVQSEEPAPLPTYDDFTLPEGITVDNELLSNFTKDLADFELTTKADHTAMQEFGQKLIDRYVAESTQTVEKLNKFYQESFEKQKTQWADDFQKDPDLGGNRSNTTINAAKSFIKTHGGNAEQQQAFHKLMDDTGLGNHPVIIRLLANAGTNMQEGKPLPGRMPSQVAIGKVAKRYGTN